MLKLRLLLAIIKKNWKIPIYLLFFGFALWTYNIERNKRKVAERREHNLKSEKLELAKKDSLNTITIAEIKDSLEGVSLAYQNLGIKYKQLSFTGEAIQIELENNRDSVPFGKETECVKVSGFTKTNPPEYGLDVFLRPFNLEIEITDFDNDIYGIVKPSNSCVKIENVEFKAAPDLKGVYRDGFDRGDFILGGLIGVCVVGAYALLH
jgi:hypothetical protein